MYMKMFAFAVLLALGWCPIGGAADAKPMTNQDVINMVRAKLPESTVVMAIRAAEPEFDTSADGLIKLKTAGVTQNVIETIITVQGGAALAHRNRAQGRPRLLPDRGIRRKSSSWMGESARRCAI